MSRGLPIYRVTERQAAVISVCLDCPLPDCVEGDPDQIHRCPLRDQALLDSGGQHTRSFTPRTSTLRRIVQTLKRESPLTANRLAQLAGVNEATIRRYIANEILILDGKPQRGQWTRITAVHPNHIPA